MRLKLATRLTCYFLASMTAVLVGFSIALFLLADTHLRRQVDDRLESALNTLVAAAEVGAEGVEWEPQERNLAFARRTLEGGFVWRVGDEQGHRLDGLATGVLDSALTRVRINHGHKRRSRPYFDVDDAGVNWRAATLKLARVRPGQGSPPLAPGRHEALILGVAASLEGPEATLRNLALTLAGLSLLVGLIALIFGAKLCRVVLRPVAAMAEATHAIGGEDPAQRLPTSGTGDELDELGQSFNALLDRLAESLQRQQRFTGDASHQLRTPLTALQGHVEVALRQDRSGDEYRRVLGVVRSRARHLRQIIDSLMFLSRADAEAMRPALEPVALGAWLDAYLDSWVHPRQADVVRADPWADCDAVRVHPPLLGELIGNLLDNAAKYSPPGTAIRVGLAQVAGAARLTIGNDGAGIAPSDLPHIFTPFFRAEADRIQGTVGTGLGLSVAARIAAAFGGRIEATSLPGSGASFVLCLPVLARTEAPFSKLPAYSG